MTGGTYDHLLIIGTFCSFIQGMTSAWLLHNMLIPTVEVQPEKLRVPGNPRKGIISVWAGFYASRDTEFSVPKINVNIKIFIISGFVYLHDAPVFKGSNHMRTDTFFYHLILSSVTCHLVGNRVRMSSLHIIVEALESLPINESW